MRNPGSFTTTLIVSAALVALTTSVASVDAKGKGGGTGGKTSTAGSSFGKGAAKATGGDVSQADVSIKSVSDAADTVFQTVVNGKVAAKSLAIIDHGGDPGATKIAIKGLVNVNGGIGHVAGFKSIRTHVGKNDAWVQVDSIIQRDKALARDGDKKLKVGTGNIAVYAVAKGGLFPLAKTSVHVGKVTLTRAEAIAGVGAKASGGVHTIIKHFGPGGKDEIAITYTNKAMSEAIETPKSATAFSEYAAKNQVFTAKDINAAIQVAAIAYATAGNNYAAGYGTVGEKAHANGGQGNTANGALFLKAAGDAVGVVQLDPPGDHAPGFDPAFGSVDPVAGPVAGPLSPVVVLTGVDPITHQVTQHHCSWNGSGGQLTCKAVVKHG